MDPITNFLKQLTLDTNKLTFERNNCLRKKFCIVIKLFKREKFVQKKNFLEKTQMIKTGFLRF
jgi:hypothetical protein